ncbi:MAG: DUF1080 domain-containing protein [Armatimonadetes bacterium]|nr:DUF1080 domain-containing protein [Armatimonadota bacterium]
MTGLAGATALGLCLPMTGNAASRAGDPDSTDAPRVPAPKGATMLFDGQSLSQWVNRNNGQPAGWKVQNGYVEVAPGNGDILTKEKFRDYQLHVEFWLPLMAEAKGQGRANSGVYNQGRIEVQVLDSYGQPPRDNEAGGIYQVAVPLRNASKRPERWQSYDIAYRAPRIGPDGKQTEKGRITVLHNGVLIHNNVEFDARTTTAGLPPEGNDYSRPGPILLQDHGNRVRYRNIWILPTPEDGKVNR